MSTKTKRILFSDPVITSYPGRKNKDLRICKADGVAYQIDITDPVEYDAAYFDKYVDYRGSETSKALNNIRATLSEPRHGVGRPAVLDVGIGSGEYLETVATKRKVYGADVNPTAIEYLKGKGWHHDLEQGIPPDVGVVTMWDVFEHLPDPTSILAMIPNGVSLCLSIPVFEDLTKIRDSKHYRPGEHHTYWTDQGIRAYFKSQGFALHTSTSRETTEAGRESIKSYRFIKG